MPPASVMPEHEPQTIILVPVQTAVCRSRGVGALVVEVATQESVDGLYLPPVFSLPITPDPPHMIISVPVQTAVCLRLAGGTLVKLVAVQESATGSYLPPVLRLEPPYPPQTIISLPVQTPVCS